MTGLGGFDRSNSLNVARARASAARRVYTSVRSRGRFRSLPLANGTFSREHDVLPSF